MPMVRRSNFQSVGWLHDLHKRGLLNMDPPYQRRSVWNQEYKNFFVDTVIAENPDRRLQIRRQIGDLFSRGVTEKKIPEETLPKDFTRFIDNFADMIRAAQLRPDDSVSVARKLVDIIMERDQREFPRSLSLLQFCFAEATLNSFIGQLRGSYTVPITPELESLYPHVRGYAQRFSLD
jgi:hypothetical protein